MYILHTHTHTHTYIYIFSLHPSYLNQPQLMAVDGIQPWMATHGTDVIKLFYLSLMLI